MKEQFLKNQPLSKGDLVYFAKHSNIKVFNALILDLTLFRLQKDRVHYKAYADVLIDSSESKAEFYYNSVIKSLWITLIFSGSFINHAKVIDIIKA